MAAAMIYSMAEGAGTLVTDDGRVLAWVDGGDRTGYPVIGLHATPGCGLSRSTTQMIRAIRATRATRATRCGCGGARYATSFV